MLRIFFMSALGVALLTSVGSSPRIAGADEAATWKFDFGSGPAALGYRVVTPETQYNAAQGFGFESIPTGGPLLFSANIPEGTYDVTVVLGDAKLPTDTTVKAEARRLMLHAVRTAPGQFERRTFTVAVKRPSLKSGQKLSLKPSQGAMDWDDHLTLEFSGPKPGVSAVEITPARNYKSLFIAGDSTVTNQRSEPYVGWGQMLPCFFQSGLAVHNGAESGASLSSFEHAGLLQKMWDTARPGDFLFIQFGHNDQKDKAPGAGPFTSYKSNLEHYIEEARKRGVIPVLVTPMERRNFQGGQFIPSLADYAEAVRQTGAEEKVPVIDLNSASIQLYEALGPERSRTAFVQYPANTFPDQPDALKDNTHFNSYGAYELVRIITTAIHDQKLEVGRFLTDNFQPFDPQHPDDAAALALPSSALKVAAKPEGN